MEVTCWSFLFSSSFHVLPFEEKTTVIQHFRSGGWPQSWPHRLGISNGDEPWGNHAIFSALWVACGSWFCQPYSLQKNGHPLRESSIHSEERVQGSSLEWVTTLCDVPSFSIPPALIHRTRIGGKYQEPSESVLNVRKKGMSQCAWVNHGNKKQTIALTPVWHSKVDPIVDFHTSYGAEVLRIVPDFRPEDVDNQGVSQQNFVWIRIGASARYHLDSGMKVRENWRFLLMQSLEKYRNPIWSFEMFEKPVRCFGDRSCCWKILVVRGFWRNAAPPAEAAHTRVLPCTGLRGNVEFTVRC